MSGYGLCTVNCLFYFHLPVFQVGRDELRSSLQPLKRQQLRERALRAGADTDVVDKVDELEKSALVDLVLQLEMNASLKARTREMIDSPSLVDRGVLLWELAWHSLQVCVEKGLLMTEMSMNEMLLLSMTEVGDRGYGSRSAAEDTPKPNPQRHRGGGTTAQAGAAGDAGSKSLATEQRL